MNKNFADLREFAGFIQQNEKGHIVITHLNLPGYPGMVLYIGMQFDVAKEKYKLNLEWMSFGLDFYGDTLQESYHYEFNSLEILLKYLATKYNIKVQDIPIKYSFDHTQFPNLLKDQDQKPHYELAWKNFQQEFKNGAFRDSSLKLVYSSQDTMK